jgi:hypothetical protein
VVTDGETGRLVGVDDGPGLCQTLADLLESPAQREVLGEAGRVASARFGRSDTFTRVEKVLIKATGRPFDAPQQG